MDLKRFSSGAGKKTCGSCNRSRFFSELTVGSQSRTQLEERIMTKIAAAMLSICLMMAGGSASAQDAMKKNDTMMKDSMAKDGMKKDGMAKDCMSKDAMAKDGMKKDAMGKDSMKKDAMAHNTMDKDCTDAMAKDGMKKDAMSKDAMKK